MPELKGTVRCVRVGDDFGFTTVTVASQERCK